MPCGFCNLILRANLSSRQIRIEEPGELFFRTYFGGWGVIAHYLLTNLKPGVDPLGPDNVLVFATGVVTGAPVGGSGRSAVGAKSPLTGGFGEADVGGFWGAELKRAGWDGIVITGQADRPVYLWIEDTQVETRDAAHLWGKNTAEVEASLKLELGDSRLRVAQCGVAGENRVRYACVISDLNRAAGRTGLGAVMGAKKLKAVAVRGSDRVQIVDRDRVRRIAEWLRDDQEQWAGFQEHGTGVTIAWAMECFQRGLLTEEDTGGLELRFENASAVVTLIEQIAHRQGFGDLLAEGCLRASQRIGQGAGKYAMQVKGQEIPMHEPRAKFALSLGYATSPTGADHMHNIHDTDYVSEAGIQNIQSLGILEPLPVDDLGPEKVRLTKYHIDWQVFYNCLGMCMFMPYSREQIRDIVQGVTGWNSSIFELIKVGERALAMARAFNYREGFTPQDDAAHWRFSVPFGSDPHQGANVTSTAAISSEDVVQATILYYGMCGWDEETGAPTTSKLHELGVGWVADLLYGN